MFDDPTAYCHESVVASYISYHEVAENNELGGSRDPREALDAGTALFHCFNSETGEAEAMPELEGATVTTSIRVPSYVTEISLSHEESGHEYFGSVELSESESQ